MSALFAPSRPWCNHRGRRRHWILIQISENQEKEQQRGNKTGCEPFVLLLFFFHLMPGELLPSLLRVSKVDPTVLVRGRIARKWDNGPNLKPNGKFRVSVEDGRQRDVSSGPRSLAEERFDTGEDFKLEQTQSVTEHFYFCQKCINYSLKLLLPVLCVCMCVEGEGGGAVCRVFRVIRFLHHPTLWHRAKNTFTQVMLLWY